MSTTQPGSWSINLDPDTTVGEAVALMRAFGCRCRMTVDFEIVLRPRHPETPPPTAAQIADLLEHGMVMVAPEGVTFEEWLQA